MKVLTNMYLVTLPLIETVMATLELCIETVIEMPIDHMDLYCALIEIRTETLILCRGLSLGFR